MNHLGYLDFKRNDEQYRINKMEGIGGGTLPTQTPSIVELSTYFWYRTKCARV